PQPAPDGTRFVVPVTQWSLDTNESVTRLWLGTTDGASPPRPLTQAELSAGQASWSPDGKRIAFIRKPGGKPDEKKKSGPKNPDQPQLHVMAVDGGEPERFTDLPLGASDPRWFPGGRRIAFVAPVYADHPGLEATAKKKKERDDDPCKVHVSEDRIYRYWDKWLTDGRVHHIFAIDLESREMTDLTPGWKRWFAPDDPSGQYRIAPDGREIAFSSCRSDPPHDPWLWGIFLLEITAGGKGGRIRELKGGDFPDVMQAEYSPDGKRIVYGVRREIDFYADKVRLVAYDRARDTHRVLTEAWDRSASGWTFGADSRTVYVRAEDRAQIALYSLDVTKKALLRPLVRRGTFTAPEIAGGKAFVMHCSLSAPPEAAVIDLKARKLRRVTEFTKPLMKDIQLSAVEEVYFTGAGGHPVQMYVLYPPGEKIPKAPRPAGRRWPLVHMIHGGPHGVFGDDWHWRWNAHAFAAPGYVVALVNFHGSTSWGQEFAASILGRWGDQPYYDVTVATDLLLSRGIVDPKRMAATGGSYGGYMAAWIASQTDRYACIINHAGVCDLQTQYASDVTQGRQRSMGGEPWDRVEAMDRWNPMRHARGFRSPMLVIHGEKDYRVPYVAGLEIYNVYKAMKLPARLVVYPEENHWILKPRTSRHWYGEVLAWLRRWIGRRR
ncbi:MAG: S9 family peptidase, partial [Planctomycetes bacterium]|nr:S9 family peptidase [Planctomycetota bacterium]